MPRAFFLVGDGDVHVEATMERAAGLHGAD
jgi:hypothetical protein